MNIKTCTKCGKTKEKEDFSPRKDSPDGRRSYCKLCEKESKRSYYNRNKETLSEKRKKYYENNKQKLTEKNKEYVNKNKEKASLRKKEWYKKNKLKRSLQEKQRYLEKKEYIKQKTKQYYSENRESCLKKKKESRERNKFKGRDKKREYEKDRYKNDTNYRIKQIVRKSFLSRLKKKGFIKDRTFFSFTEFTWNEYIEHFEKDPLFQNFKNRANIHIDHIIPCSAYDFTDPEEIKKCWSPRNLRLLPAKENSIKNNHINFDLIHYYSIQDLIPKSLFLRKK